MRLTVCCNRLNARAPPTTQSDTTVMSIAFAPTNMTTGYYINTSRNKSAIDGSHSPEPEARAISSKLGSNSPLGVVSISFVLLLMSSCLPS